MTPDPSFDNTGSELIDLSNPAKPVRLALNRFGPPGHWIPLAETIALFGPSIYDISDFSSPKPLGFLDFGLAFQQQRTFFLDVVLSGQFAFVKYTSPSEFSDSGLGIFDIRNPARPIRLANYKTTGFPWRIALQGDLLYLASDYPSSGRSGFEVVNVSDPLNPTFIGGWYGGTNYSQPGIVISDSLAFFHDRLGLKIVDIGVFSHPEVTLKARRVGTQIDLFGLMAHLESGNSSELVNCSEIRFGWILLQLQKSMPVNFPSSSTRIRQLITSV